MADDGNSAGLIEGCSACVCVGYDVDRGIPDGSGICNRGGGPDD